MSNEVYWHPLESNPEGMNNFIHSLGVDKKWAFTDIWGLDPELLAVVPQPCRAVILLFPITDNYNTFFQEQNEQIQQDGQKISDKIYFLKQTVRNACGTYAVLHALGNNQDEIPIDGALKKFFEDTANLSPVERSEALKVNKELADAHTQSAHKGQTKTPEPDAKVDLHFVCFTQHDGDLYELDGRRTFPINHGQSNDLLADTAKIVQKFIEREPDRLQFTLIALSANQDHQS